MHANLNIRPSIDADMPAMTDIYAHHVQHGAGSFETEAPNVAEMARRRSSVQQSGLPWLVAEAAGGIIAGYAYASAYRTRPAYRFTVEDSIYMHPSHTGNGVGSALLSRLIELCEQTGWRQMIAVIGDSGNVASVRLHAKFGFRHVGVLQSVGFKFGRWVDTILMQRHLGSGALTLPGESPER
jgi:L-amino acid N-acyltransferase YncA